MKTLTPSISVTLLPLAILLAACQTTADPYQSPPPASRVDPVTQTGSPDCYGNCGTITRVDAMTSKGEGSGLGMVLGAVVGAVVGNQVGDGRGNDAATVGGAVVGGYAGNEVEKRVKGTKYFQVTVDMDNNGGTRTFDVASMNGLGNGSRVKVVGGNLQSLG